MNSIAIRFFVLCLMLAVAAPAVAQKGKKKGKQKLALHPGVEAYFVLPGDLQPNAQQQKQLAKLRRAYGPRLQAMAPAVVQALKVRDANATAKPILRRAGKARRAGVQAPRLGARGSRKNLNRLSSASREVIRKFQALEGEIERQIEEMLTPEQKKSLAAQKRQEKKNGSKKKAKGN